MLLATFTPSLNAVKKFKEENKQNPISFKAGFTIESIEKRAHHPIKTNVKQTDDRGTKTAIKIENNKETIP